MTPARVPVILPADDRPAHLRGDRAQDDWAAARVPVILPAARVCRPLGQHAEGTVATMYHRGDGAQDDGVAYYDTDTQLAAVRVPLILPAHTPANSRVNCARACLCARCRVPCFFLS